jgi:hypothetical protein
LTKAIAALEKRQQLAAGKGQGRADPGSRSRCSIVPCKVVVDPKAVGDFSMDYESIELLKRDSVRISGGRFHMSCLDYSLGAIRVR